MKSLFIRCSEETYSLAHALAKAENKSEQTNNSHDTFFG